MIKIIICITIGIIISCGIELHRKHVDKKYINQGICPICKKELRELEPDEDGQSYICDTCGIGVFVPNNKK